MIRGGFPIKINGYALGSQENLAEGCREVIIAFFLFKMTIVVIKMTIVNYFSGEREQLRQMGTKSEKQTGCSSSQ